MKMYPKFLIVTACLWFFAGSAPAQNWPQWRGPEFNGSSTAKNLPESLDPAKDLLWQVDLPGQGAGTPIVFEDRVFVSAQESSTQKLLGQCFDRKTGKLLWQVEVGQGFGGSRMNNMASPSAITDGKSVFFFFASGDLAAFDMEGKPLWSRNLQKDHGNFHIQFLYGSSALLYRGRLYVPVMHRDWPYGGRRPDQPAESYLLAIDAATGKDVFKHIRPEQASGESKESYCTPTPYEGAGRREIIIVGADCVTGHDPDTGKELWRCGGWNDRHEGNLRIVPSVTVAADRFIVSSPKVRGITFAIKPGGNGLITGTHIEWQNREARSDVPSPLYYQENLYILDGDFRKGLACLDPANGQIKWFTPVQSQRVLRASPTGADGKIYFMSEGAEVWVLSAADGRVLYQGRLETNAPARASITAAQDTLFVRTGEKLYAFGKKP